MDACPMGVRVVGPAAQRTYDAVELYEIAAARMEHWKRWCERGHRGNKPIALFHSPHHFMAHYNQGNPIYAHQVLGLLAVLDRRTISASDEALFTERTKETVRRLVRAFKARRA